MKLRPYQEKAITELRESFRRGNKRVILQLATAGGKTALSSCVISQAIEKGNRVIVFVPRRELAYQFVATLKKMGVDAAFIMSGEGRSISKVHVASFDTFESWVVSKQKMLPPKADMIIVDEAHIYLGKQMRFVEKFYSNAFIVGLTATPARASGAGLGAFYQDMVLGVSIKELTEQGFLSPVRYFAPTKVDLSNIKLNKDGDYQAGQLEELMSEKALVGDIVLNWMRIAPNRQTVVFCSGVKHSIHVRDEFLKHGIRAEQVDGNTEEEERKAILARVASGETQVLTNVFVATYGLDIPVLSCAVLARPTKNIALYLQMVGRIMRICEGKEDAIVIDHARVVEENGMAADEQYWSLDVGDKVKDRKKKKEVEKKEKKNIECTKCKAVYKAEKICPNCGHEWEMWGEEVPYIEADLEEINPKKDNRETSWEDKISFIGELKHICRTKGYSAGWVAHKYKEKFGVFPNDPRVKNAPAINPSKDVSNWLKYLTIRDAKRRGK